MQNATAKYGVNRLENQQFVFVPLFHWSSRDLCKPFGKLVRFSTLAVIPHAGFRGFALGNGSRNTALAQGTQAKVLKGASITIEGPIEKHWKGQISINKKLWICNDRFGLQTDCHCDDISIGLRCLRGHPRQQLHILRQLHRVEWQSQDPKGRCHLKKPRLCHLFFFFFFSIFFFFFFFFFFIFSSFSSFCSSFFFFIFFFFFFSSSSGPLLEFRQISIFLMFFWNTIQVEHLWQKIGLEFMEDQCGQHQPCPIWNIDESRIPCGARAPDLWWPHALHRGYGDISSLPGRTCRGATKNPKQEIPNVAWPQLVSRWWWWWLDHITYHNNQIQCYSFWWSWMITTCIYIYIYITIICYILETKWHATCYHGSIN